MSKKENLTSLFESMPVTEKVDVLEDLISLLSTDLPDDPVLNNQTDLLDSICCNIVSRIDEIKAVYGG